MTTITRPAQPIPSTAPVTRENTTAMRIIGGLTRISLGWIFLWAFLDKMVGLGHENRLERRLDPRR
jgi:thiosulfate dehydrogenase [quinone] large subunit